MRSMVFKFILWLGLAAITAMPVWAARSYVRGYYRKDGTYVRGHYRDGAGGASAPRANASGSRTGAASSGAGSFLGTGYFRRDGTYVPTHRRSRPDGIVYNNVSYRQVGVDRGGTIAPGADLRRLRFPDADFSRANLAGVDLTGVQLEAAKLAGAELSEAELTEGRLAGADLRGAVLEQAELIRADLAGADLTGIQATGARFDGATLRKTLLRQADLTDASFAGADLTGADLQQAKLCYAHFQVANLEEANLEGADLRGADLSSARLGKARLKGALYSPATEWPTGFNPGAAGAVQREEEGAGALMEGDEGAQALLARISARLEAGELLEAEKLSVQLSDLLRQARQPQPGELPGALPPARGMGEIAPQPLTTSPAKVTFPGGIKGTITFEDAIAYVLEGVDRPLDGNIVGEIKVQIPGALADANQRFKVRERELHVTYASTDEQVVQVTEDGGVYIQGGGEAKIILRTEGAAWSVPVRVVELPIRLTDNEAVIFERLGPPDVKTRNFWSWKKFPGLRLSTGYFHTVRSNWKYDYQSVR